MKKVLALLLVTALPIACDDDDGPVAPNLDVRGNYALAELSFDPQGSLPAVDLLARIQTTVPRLVLATNRRAQLVYEDLSTGLVTTADASYEITIAGDVRVTFEQGSLYRGSFLSRVMTFTFTEQPRTLTFNGTSPDGIDLDRLLRLVPEWREEQLFDPVPGTLRVVYRVN